MLLAIGNIEFFTGSESAGSKYSFTNSGLVTCGFGCVGNDDSIGFSSVGNYCVTDSGYIDNNCNFKRSCSKGNDYSTNSITDTEWKHCTVSTPNAN